MTEKQLENYIKGKYIGIVKGNYETYCPLKASEINNFVQNVGKYADLEIIKLKDMKCFLILMDSLLIKYGLDYLFQIEVHMK